MFSFIMKLLGLSKKLTPKQQKIKQANIRRQINQVAQELHQKNRDIATGTESLNSGVPSHNMNPEPMSGSVSPEPSSKCEAASPVPSLFSPKKRRKAKRRRFYRKIRGFFRSRGK